MTACTCCLGEHRPTAAEELATERAAREKAEAALASGEQERADMAWMLKSYGPALATAECARAEAEAARDDATRTAKASALVLTNATLDERRGRAEAEAGAARLRASLEFAREWLVVNYCTEACFCEQHGWPVGTCNWCRVMPALASTAGAAALRVIEAGRALAGAVRRYQRNRLLGTGSVEAALAAYDAAVSARGG